MAQMVDLSRRGKEEDGKAEAVVLVSLPFGCINSLLPPQHHKLISIGDDCGMSCYGCYTRKSEGIRILG